MFDAKEFCRKLAWKAYFQSIKEVETNSDSRSDGEELFQQSDGEDQICGWTRSKKLKIKSKKYPGFKVFPCLTLLCRVKSALD